MVSNDEITAVIANSPINEAVESLIQKALDAGANDNVSVILVKGDSDAFGHQSRTSQIQSVTS